MLQLHLLCRAYLQHRRTAPVFANTDYVYMHASNARCPNNAPWQCCQLNCPVLSCPVLFCSALYCPVLFLRGRGQWVECVMLLIWAAVLQTLNENCRRLSTNRTQPIWTDLTWDEMSCHVPAWVDKINLVLRFREPAHMRGQGPHRARAGANARTVRFPPNEKQLNGPVWPSCILV